MSKNQKSTAKSAPKQLVAGRFREGTTIANLFQKLMDGKKHSEAQLKSCLDDKKTDLHSRLVALARHGNESRTWKWQITREGTSVQMKIVKRPSKSASKPAVRPAEQAVAQAA